MMARGIRMFARKWLLTLVCLLARDAGLGQSSVAMDATLNSARSLMGIREVVVAWDAEALIRTARGQGYRVYAEVPVGKAAEIIRSGEKNNLAGIVINSGNSQADQIDEDLRQLHSAFPGLPGAGSERARASSRR